MFTYNYNIIKMSDTTDNSSRQFEELEALKSIYGDEWHVDITAKSSYSITLVEGPLHLELFITLPKDYPGKAPPLFQILAPDLSRPDMQEINCILQDVYLENVGETVIYQWVERAREWLQDKAQNTGNSDLLHAGEDGKNTVEKQCEEDEEEDFSSSFKRSETYQKTETANSSLCIIHGDPISAKKSTFQGHVATVMCVDQVKQVIAELLQNKKIAHATHNMYAYRIFREDTNSFTQDCDDDGEAQAGGRLLHLLQIMDVRNALVVVSRWYGGIHLGPDRFRLINNAARQVIEKAGLIPPPDQKRKK